MTPSLTAPAVPGLRLSRNAVIAAGVVLLHVAAIWGLHSGLLRRAAEIVVPVEILAQIIEPPAPKPEPPAVQPPAPAPPPPAPKPVRKVQPAPRPRPVPAPAPEPAPAIAVSPQPAVPDNAPVIQAAPPAPSAPPAPPAPPRPVAVELPSSSADYLQNPPPAYPAMSRRLGEQGQVLVRVLIGADGTAQQANVARSSGYERLDQAALNAVLKWRYVPGKRGGVPEAMWFNVPINFVLEQ